MKYAFLDSILQRDTSIFSNINSMYIYVSFSVYAFVQMLPLLFQSIAILPEIPLLSAVNQRNCDEILKPKESIREIF